MSKIITLNAHGFEAEVWTRGAHVVRLVHKAGRSETPLLFSPPSRAPGDSPRWFGSWPMLPLCNRAFGAKLDTGVEVFDLPPNDPAGFNIHGFGWQNDWEVTFHSENRLVLQHVASSIGPYSYRAQMAFTLDQGGVTFDLILIHLGEKPMPYGMGFHPWFPANAETRLHFNASRELYVDAGFHPKSSGPIHADHNFTSARQVRLQKGGKDTETAANYLDWDGFAQIDWPDIGKSLELRASPNLRYPLVWSPIGAEFVCFEPQSHAVGAQTEGLVRALAPLQMLAKGQVLQGSIHFALKDLAP